MDSSRKNSLWIPLEISPRIHREILSRIIPELTAEQISTGISSKNCLRVFFENSSLYFPRRFSQRFLLRLLYGLLHGTTMFPPGIPPRIHPRFSPKMSSGKEFLEKFVEKFVGNSWGNF